MDQSFDVLGRPLVAVAAAMVLMACAADSDEEPEVIARDGLAADQVLSGPPTCEGCGWNLELVTRIHDAAGAAGWAQEPLSVARSSLGDVFVSTMRFEALHFDGDGRFQGLVGSEGDGPGEFRSVGAVNVGPGDTLQVLDLSLGRLSYWSPDGEFVQSVPAPSTRIRKVLALDDGSWIFAAPFQIPERMGFPFHRWTPDGELGESFGPRTSVEGRSDLRFMGRHIARLNDSGFWAAHEREYIVDRVSTDGEVFERLARRVEWFPKPDTIIGANPEVAFSPRVRSLHVDDAGRLWLLITTAGEDFRAGWGDERISELGMPYREIADWPVVFDSYIEVWDPYGPEVLVSERFPNHYFVALLDGEHVAGFSTDEFGVPILEVFALRVSGLE